VRGKGTKLSKPCPKVRLSQDRLPIEPFSGLLRSFGIVSFGIVSSGKSSWHPIFFVSLWVHFIISPSPLRSAISKLLSIEGPVS
jgi:hypothetical protein